MSIKNLRNLQELGQLTKSKYKVHEATGLKEYKKTELANWIACVHPPELTRIATSLKQAAASTQW